MLPQYQLHGGIRRLQTRFDKSKRVGLTTTMAASAAPTPWNRPPPSIDDLRWWDEIFLKLCLPVMSEDATIVHRMTDSGEPHHGKMHTLLVPALEEFFSCLDEPRLKKSLSSETLKTASFPCSQTTHSHQVRRIRQNRLKNKNGDYHLPNRGADLQG